MKLYEIEEKAAKCFPDASEFYKKVHLFLEDYQFFTLYMKRNTRSVEFKPAPYSISLQHTLKNSTQDDIGIERAYATYIVVRQLILDMLPWNTPVYEQQEHDELLRYMVKREWIDIDVFCTEFISCSHAHPEVRQRIDDILNASTDETE